ncbi:Zinc-finger homeodomain protein 2 [Striga hermonthica]|uniref:Zinc-finger homeodomain protein 2 n=1 Tax=Striga hermonthica TaxID=68872 RepID=A0A9N7RL65_STRHE|nr:Zinc-finger homeodomain protein 2 [Striga hermonthica]
MANFHQQHVLVMFKDCQHNHAAQAQGFTLDGCGLFEPNGPNATPESLFCAACGCHRNFHRRVEVDLPHNYSTQNVNPTSPHHQPSDEQPQAQEPSSNSPSANGRQEVVSGLRETGPARVRNRITREQSERMREIAERNEWRMFRDHSEEEIRRICSEVGITRNMLRRWICYHRANNNNAAPAAGSSADRHSP